MHLNQTEPIIESKEIPIDAKIEVSISSDRLVASIALTPPQYEGKEMDEASIRGALHQAGIVYGILEDKVVSLAQTPIYHRTIDIAKGMSPVAGVDGRLEYHVPIQRTSRPKEREDGTVNFWELDILLNVSQGDLLCTLHLPTLGTDGITVHGVAIAAKPGVKPLLPLGKNVSHDEEKLHVYAAIPGNLIYKNMQLHVDPVFHVTGDVDISTGNINFIGNVVINGNVREGFQVQAKGDITVYGMIEAAKLHSEGNIIIRGGIFGSSRAEIVCGGNLKCKYLESASVTCKGDLTTEYMVNSSVICEGEVELVGQRALITGGDYVVLKKLNARTVGSSSGTPTRIQLGSYGTLLEKKKQLMEEVETLEANDIKLQQIIVYLQDMKKRGLVLSGDREKMLLDSVRTKAKLLLQKSSLLKSIETFDLQIQGEGKQSLSCSQTLYRGTTIMIKNAVFYANEDYSKKTFYYDDANAKIAISNWA